MDVSRKVREVFEGLKIDVWTVDGISISGLFDHVPVVVRRDQQVPESHVHAKEAQ